MAIPIWKDKIVNLPGDTADFRILIDSTDEVIYSGRAHIRPDATTNSVRINDICADYLVNVLPTLAQAKTQPIDFRLEAKVMGDWSLLGHAEFYNDWSYDDSYNPSTMGMSFPINGNVDARQLIFYSSLGSGSVLATFKSRSGLSLTVLLSIVNGNVIVDLSEHENLAMFTIGNSTFQVVTDCAEWVLYYVNAFGGWDSFLIEGETSIVDNLTRRTIDVEYDNRNIQNRGRRNFANGISKVYTMHTGLLNDSESERMHHLLNSTEVYLYNINSGEMIPVTLNNTATEYKTFMGNGGEMSTYTIEATLAQDRMRR